MKRSALLMAIFMLLAISGHHAAASEPTWDVVVIGAGGGGLAAGAKLALAGKTALVLEQHYKVGGYMTNFERGPYTFEVSLHAMDGLNENGMTRQNLTALGIIDKIKPVKLDPMYRAVYPDFTIDVPADVDRYREELKRIFPAEATGIDGLFKEMKDINGGVEVVTMLVAGDAKAMFQMHRLAPLLRTWNMTLSEMLAQYTRNEKLIAVFTQLAGFAGQEPDKLSAAFFSFMWCAYHFGGYYYFEGGSQSISNALAEVIEEHGGSVRTGMKVTKIEVEDGKATAVVTEDGSRFRCRFVVSNVNVPATIKMIGRDKLPGEWLKKVDNLKIGLTCLVVYLGVDHDYSASFPEGSHEIMVNKTYRQAEAFAFNRQGDLDNMSFAVANYTLPDPKTAPPGKSVICVTVMMDYEWNDNWRENDPAAYKALKEEVAKKLIARAEEYLPGLSSHIEVMEVGSPRTMEHFTLNPKGTIFGWDNTPEQSMLKRLPQTTPVKNLYLAGAWTFPGGGQSAVLASGLMAAQRIIKADK